MRRSESGDVMIHKALNTLLQAAGAIVMKWAMVLLDERVRRLNLRAWKVLDIHDEGQWECHPEDLIALRGQMEVCVRDAGVLLGVNCPLASDSIAGRSWYDTH
ncbi:DNA polymerase [Pseudomonas phage vB_Pae_WS1160]